MKTGLKTKYYWDYFRQTPNGIFLGRLYHKLKDGESKALKAYACAYQLNGLTITMELPTSEEEYYN